MIASAMCRSCISAAENGSSAWYSIVQIWNNVFTSHILSTKLSTIAQNISYPCVFSVEGTS